MFALVPTSHFDHAWQMAPGAPPETLSERAYFDVRRRVLSAQGADYRITRQDLVEHSGLARARVGHVLAALVAEGYLFGQRTQRDTVFATSHWTPAQISEWCTMTAGIVTVCLGQTTVDGRQTALGPLISAAKGFVDASGEDALFSMVRFFTAMFEASLNPEYKQIVSDIVPSAFLRLAWVSDLDDELPPLASEMIDALSRGNLPSARKANVYFWGTAEVRIGRYLDDRRSGTLENSRIALCVSRDVGLSGQVRPFGRPGAAALLPPLASL